MYHKNSEPIMNNLKGIKRLKVDKMIKIKKEMLRK